jgi:hypothetical protein
MLASASAALLALAPSAEDNENVAGWLDVAGVWWLWSQTLQTSTPAMKLHAARANCRVGIFILLLWLGCCDAVKRPNCD